MWEKRELFQVVVVAVKKNVENPMVMHLVLDPNKDF